jgi:hypothetical protein
MHTKLIRCSAKTLDNVVFFRESVQECSICPLTPPHPHSHAFPVDLIFPLSQIITVKNTVKGPFKDLMESSGFEHFK